MAQQYAANVDRLPDHMKDGARSYIEEGRTPHGFLRAVLTDSLTEAVGKADGTNEAHIKSWVMWLYNDIPASAWGSEEAIRQWCEQGGMDGL